MSTTDSAPFVFLRGEGSFMGARRESRAARIWTRGTKRRAARRVAVVLVLALSLVTAAPPSGLAKSGTPWVGLAELWSWFTTPPAWAAPKPPTPEQESGTAKDKPNYVSS